MHVHVMMVTCTDSHMYKDSTLYVQVPCNDGHIICIYIISLVYNSGRILSESILGVRVGVA